MGSDCPGHADRIVSYAAFGGERWFRGKRCLSTSQSHQEDALVISRVLLSAPATRWQGRRRCWRLTAACMLVWAPFAVQSESAIATPWLLRPGWGAFQAHRFNLQARLPCAEPCCRPVPPPAAGGISTPPPDHGLGLLVAAMSQSAGKRHIHSSTGSFCAPAEIGGGAAADAGAPSTPPPSTSSARTTTAAADGLRAGGKRVRVPDARARACGVGGWGMGREGRRE